MLWERLKRTWAFTAALRDRRAWLIIALCAGGVSLFDPVMAKTVMQWVLFFGVFAGLAVIISRHVLPQVKLDDYLAEAYRGNVGAALVVVGVLIQMGFLILSVVLWAKV